jgi:hypothetical protein
VSHTFISPLDDDVIKGLCGDRKNIGHAAGLLKPILGIPRRTDHRRSFPEAALEYAKDESSAELGG